MGKADEAATKRPLVGAATRKNLRPSQQDRFAHGFLDQNYRNLDPKERQLILCSAVARMDSEVLASQTTVEKPDGSTLAQANVFVQTEDGKDILVVDYVGVGDSEIIVVTVDDENNVTLETLNTLHNLSNPVEKARFDAKYIQYSGEDNPYLMCAKKVERPVSGYARGNAPSLLYRGSFSPRNAPCLTRAPSHSRTGARSSTLSMSGEPGTSNAPSESRRGLNLTRAIGDGDFKKAHPSFTATPDCGTRKFEIPKNGNIFVLAASDGLRDQGRACSNSIISYIVSKDADPGIQKITDKIVRRGSWSDNLTVVGISAKDLQAQSEEQQAVTLGVYDGHGGEQTSEHCSGKFIRLQLGCVDEIGRHADATSPGSSEYNSDLALFLAIYGGGASVADGSDVFCFTQTHAELIACEEELCNTAQPMERRLAEAVKSLREECSRKFVQQAAETTPKGNEERAFMQKQLEQAIQLLVDIQSKKISTQGKHLLSKKFTQNAKKQCPEFAKIANIVFDAALDVIALQSMGDDLESFSAVLTSLIAHERNLRNSKTITRQDGTLSPQQALADSIARLRESLSKEVVHDARNSLKWGIRKFSPKNCYAFEQLKNTNNLLNDLQDSEKGPTAKLELIEQFQKQAKRDSHGWRRNLKNLGVFVSTAIGFVVGFTLGALVGIAAGVVKGTAASAAFGPLAPAAAVIMAVAAGSLDGLVFAVGGGVAGGAMAYKASRAMFFGRKTTRDMQRQKEKLIDTFVEKAASVVTPSS